MPASKRKRIARSTASSSTQSRKTRSSILSQRLPATQPMKVSFLDLPLEIRQKIYAAFFQLGIPRHHCDRYCPRGCLRDTDSTSLLHLSRQVHAETWPLFTEHHTFRFDKPYRLANDFLSFLPSQRLLAVKHLTLVNEDWLAAEQLQSLEHIWWCYLDVFSRLDTITFEHPSNRSIVSGGLPIDLFSFWGFHRLISVVVNLLRQGANKKPKWISKNSHGYMAPPPNNLPPSHEWEVELVQKLRYTPNDFGVWNLDSTTCCVVRPNFKPTGANQFTQFKTWWTTHMAHVFAPWFLITEVYHLQRLIPPTPDFHTLQFERAYMGFLTIAAQFVKAQLCDSARAVGKDCSRSGILTEGVSIVGQWFNNNEL